MDNNFIFKSSGIYLGFISNGFIFSRDGIYLGWLDGEFAWDTDGKFRGIIMKQNGNRYIVMNKFAVPPVPRSPRPEPAKPVLPNPPANIPPIPLSVGYKDAF